jgi:hypothetical protein
MAKKDKEKSTAKTIIAAASLTEKQRTELTKDLKKYTKSSNNVTKSELAKIQAKIDKYTKALTAGGEVSFPSMPTFTVPSSTNTTSIKLPEKDNVLSLTTNNIDEATIIAMVFEKLGAVELTKFTRTDTVEGVNPYYNIISNLSAIKKEFDPSNLVASQKSDTSLYNAFSIKLSNKIPGDQYLTDRALDNYIYVDTNGDLIIELDNMTPDELVEVEIDTNGTIVEVR